MRNLPAHWRNTLNSVQGTIEESEALRTIKITVPDLFETNQDSDETNSLDLETASVKQFYQIYCILNYKEKYHLPPCNYWSEALNTNIKPQFMATFSQPIKEDHAFIHYRMLHKAIPTGSFRYNAGFAKEPHCLFCGEYDDIFHSFIRCDHLTPLARSVTELAETAKNGYKFSIHDYITLFPIRKIEDRYLNYTFVTAQAATYKALINKIFDDGPTDPLEIFRSYIKSRIQTEYYYQKHEDSLLSFESMWCHNNTFCYLENENLKWNF